MFKSCHPDFSKPLVSRNLRLPAELRQCSRNPVLRRFVRQLGVCTMPRQKKPGTGRISQVDRLMFESMASWGSTTRPNHASDMTKSFASGSSVNLSIDSR